MNPIKIPQLGIGTFKMFQSNIDTVLRHAVKSHFISTGILNEKNNFINYDSCNNNINKLKINENNLNSSDIHKSSNENEQTLVNISSIRGYLLPYPSKLHIDTAWIYKNEKFIGDLLNEFSQQLALDSKLSDSDTSNDTFIKENKLIHPKLREQLFIVSKLPPKFMRKPKESVRKTVLESLEALRIDYFDLYLIHWPARDKTPPDDPIHKIVRKEAWLELEKLYHEGKIKQIGVSNYEIHHLEEMKEYAEVMPSTNQFEIHPFFKQKSLRQYCRENNIIITAYSPLGCSNGVERLLQHETISSISKETNKTPAQVVLRWHLQNGHVAIPRTTKIERLEENRNIFDFNLTEEQLQSIEDITIEERMCWDPSRFA